MKKLLVVLSLLFFSSSLYAGTISFDQLATSHDLTVSKYNEDMSRVYQKINTAIQTDNVEDDTLLEADMADEINPRIRTYEGASCEFVDDGLLTTTTSGTLTGSVPAGTAYPRGYRCDKTSSTPKTFTASRWTYVDIDQSCNFQYSEVTIGAAVPAIATNSIRISRVSTDGTQIGAVSDLRTTSCTAGPFDGISDSSGEATLDDLFAMGRPVRNREGQGIAQGLHVSWDTTTTFLVTGGAVYVNGEYRALSTDITVPSTTDDPAIGTSGIDTGALAANTRYNVFAVADQDAVKAYSITYSTANVPTGVTNYRKIGEITTGANSFFNSYDIVRTHGIVEDEIIKGWIHFNGAAAAATINRSRNVSALADNATGRWTVSWDHDFESISYAVAGFCNEGATGNACYANGTPSAEAFARGTLAVNTFSSGGGDVDGTTVCIIAVGDTI